MPKSMTVGDISPLIFSGNMAHFSMFQNPRKYLIGILIAVFLLSTIYVPGIQAGEVVVPLMPAPGTMVHLSSSFVPAHLIGVIIHPDNALRFDFLIHKGEEDLDDAQKKE